MDTTNRTKKMILTALMIALITVATIVIAIPTPFTSGYIHLGDSMIFLAVMILGWKYGAVAAAAGSGLADLILGYVHWAPWTVCIKGIMALLMGLVIVKCAESKKGMVVACGATAAAWIVFNIAVNRIIAYESAHNAAALLTGEAASVSELGEFLNKIQGQLMLVALLIPVFLIFISLYIKKKDHIVIPVTVILGMTLAGLWMVFGYYVAGGIMYGNFAVSAFSIPANMVQFVMGFLVAALVLGALMKTSAAKHFAYGRKK